MYTDLLTSASFTSTPRSNHLLGDHEGVNCSASNFTLPCVSPLKLWASSIQHTLTPTVTPGNRNILTCSTCGLPLAFNCPFSVYM
jgi:hypothetical protein